MRKWAILAMAFAFLVLSCEFRDSDSVQRRQQEKILAEGTSQVGMPSITNFTEKRLLKDIYELRDQTGYVTYTYLENMIPTVVHGRTALGGKLTYVGESVGYGIPYATQFTSPMKHDGTIAVPQADPNALFSPASAEGTWVLLKNPNGSDVKVVYMEPRIVVSPFKWAFD